MGAAAGYRVKGWTPDGREVVLLPWQEEAVRQILDAPASARCR